MLDLIDGMKARRGEREDENKNPPTQTTNF